MNTPTTPYTRNQTSHTPVVCNDESSGETERVRRSRRGSSTQNGQRATADHTAGIASYGGSCGQRARHGTRTVHRSTQTYRLTGGSACYAVAGLRGSHHTKRPPASAEGSQCCAPQLAPEATAPPTLHLAAPTSMHLEIISGGPPLTPCLEPTPHLTVAKRREC